MNLEAAKQEYELAHQNYMNVRDKFTQGGEAKDILRAARERRQKAMQLLIKALG